MESILHSVSEILGEYKYLAMFSILLLCGLGLPIPEEVTLIASGLAVEWYGADFFVASIVCVSAILAGDSIIFFLGHHYGRAFLASRPMRLILTRRDLRKVDRLFSRHGSKAVFFARFFAGVRIGVYAYAGKHGMPWLKFLLLDLLGALISGPASIALGWWAAHHFAESREEAARKAMHLIEEFRWLIFGALATIALFFALRFAYRRYRCRRASKPAESRTSAPSPGARP